jgi:hypothetical protein
MRSEQSQVATAPVHGKRSTTILETERAPKEAKNKIAADLRKEADLVIVGVKQILTSENPQSIRQATERRSRQRRRSARR